MHTMPLHVCTPNVPHNFALLVLNLGAKDVKKASSKLTKSLVFRSNALYPPLCRFESFHLLNEERLCTSRRA